MALLWLIHGNLMKCQEEVLNIELNQAAILHQTFVDPHVLPDINFNSHCLINNIYMPNI